MNQWALVLIAWSGQLLLLLGRRAGARLATLFGAALDIVAVAWLCAQHRWLLAGLTFIVLPLLSAAVLGFWTGKRNNRFQMREQFHAGYRDAKFKSHKDAIGRAILYGIILGVATFYPTALWKRILGALLAFFIVGLGVQFRAIRRKTPSPP